MTDPRGVHPAHLDAATIAAFVDRTLDPAARAAAEAHLATCADCREVWVETSELVNEEVRGAGRITAEAPLAPSRRWIYAGGGLAAAAAIAIVAITSIDRRSDSFQGFMLLMRDYRFSEARTSTLSRWSPAPDTLRGSGNADALLLEAARRTVDSARRDEQFLETGLALLALGQPQQAAESFRAGLARTPGDAALHLNLSAALLELCRVSCSNEERAEALQNADRALSNPDQAEAAAFNRALALEGLGRREEARNAWEAFRDTTGDISWQQEALGHLERIRPGGQL